MVNTRKATESITLRVDSSVMNQIRLESEQKLVSPNTLINQILNQYIKWHARAPNAGMIYITKSFVSSLLQKFSNEEIIQMGENELENHFKRNYFVFQEEFSIEKVIELLDYYALVSGFNYAHRIERNNHTIVIQHNMGDKVSLLLSSMIKNIFQDLSLSSYDIQELGDTVIIRLKM
jgi:hypothetical protein